MKCFKISKHPSSFFRFSFWATFIFPFMNALVYVNIDQGIHKVKVKVAQNKNRKKILGFSFYINIGNFEAFLWNLNLSTKHLFWRCGRCVNWSRANCVISNCHQENWYLAWQVSNYRLWECCRLRCLLPKKL